MKTLSLLICILGIKVASSSILPTALHLEEWEVSVLCTLFHFIGHSNSNKGKQMNLKEANNCQAQVQSPKVQILVKGLGVTLKSHGSPPHGRLHITTWPMACFHPTPNF